MNKRQRQDQRYKIIGGRKRASTRYAMIKWRLTHTDLQKNKCYANVRLLVGREEFIQWFMARDFDGASVDRIDPNGHYCLENMQVIHKTYNIIKDKLIAKDGKTTCCRCKETKPLSDFVSDHRRIATGKTTMCKQCERKRTRSNASLVTALA